MLVSSICDLDDGDTIIDIIVHLFPEAQGDGPLDLQAALRALASGIGGLPQPFTDVRVAYANVLGGGSHALCWIAAVLRFAAGDGPAVDFTGSVDFQSFVHMSSKMDQVGSPRREWGMTNGSPVRAGTSEPREDKGGVDEPIDTLPPTEAPKLDEVWRKSGGQWHPAVNEGSTELAISVNGPTSTGNTGGGAGTGNAEAPGVPTDEGAMEPRQHETYEMAKRVDLSARPAQHARAWNPSTYIDVGIGRAAAALPGAKKQLQLEDVQCSNGDPEPELPLWTWRGTLTDRGLVVGTLCDPAPGSRIQQSRDRRQRDGRTDVAVEVRKRARECVLPKRPAISPPRARSTSAARRKQRSMDRERLMDQKLDDEKPVDLNPRVGKIVKWLQTMPLDIAPLCKLGLNNPPAARPVTVPRDVLRKAFGPGRLLCQLVNVLEETHVCTSTKSHRVNVNKALALLRLRPSMIIEHLWATDELLDGDADVTFALLDHIRRSYAGKGSSSGSSACSGMRTRASIVRHEAAGVDEACLPLASTDAVSLSSDLVDPGPALDANGHEQAVRTGLSSHWTPLLPVERRSLQDAQQHENSLTDETTVRLRLRKMGFDLPSRARLATLNTSLLQDPLRNGTLLCSLVERLDPRCKLKGVARAPDSVDAAIVNVQIAFAELRRLSSKNEAWFSPKLAQDIVRGRQDLLWALLVRVTGPLDINGDTRQEGHHKSPRGSDDAIATAAAAGWCVGPYTVTQTRLLEISLLQWIQSLGHLPNQLNPAAGRSVDEAVEIMLQECSKGTMLCDLTAEICSESIPGVTRRPRVAAAQHGNISRAFEVLRRHKVVATEHLRSEENVRNCVRGTVLGLLEAMHRAYDGAPRPKPEHGKDDPYLGKGGVRGTQEYAKALEASVRGVSPELQQVGTFSRSSTPTRIPRDQRPTNSGRGAYTSHADASSSPQRPGGSKTRLPSALRIRGPAPSMIPVPASSPISSNVSSPRMSPREWDSPTRRRRRQQVAATGPLRVQLSSTTSASKSESESVVETEETTRIKVAHCLCRLIALTYACRSLLCKSNGRLRNNFAQRWIELHGFTLRHEFGLPDPSSNQLLESRLALVDFCDGTLLCDLVAKLQNRPTVRCHSFLSCIAAGRIRKFGKNA